MRTEYPEGKKAKECYYCTQIAAHDSSYEVRPARYNVDQGAPRCEAHWRFGCGMCGRKYHYAALAYCPERGFLICRNCALSERLITERFWGYTYYTVLNCPCGQDHVTLERLDFQGDLSKRILAIFPIADEEFRPEEAQRKYETIENSEIDLEKLASNWESNSSAWNRPYARLGDPLREHAVPFDLLLDQVGRSIEGLRVLDAGCGSGYLACLFAEKGAHVTGIDYSHSQLELARLTAGNRNLDVEFIHASITNMNALEDSSFDIVVCVTALSNVRDYQSAMLEIGRVLKPCGKLLVVEIHPCFSMNRFRKCVAVWDSQRYDEIMHWAVDQYFDTRPVRTHYSTFPAPTTTFRRTLSEYINSIVGGGMLISSFHEPIPSTEAICQYPKVLAERAQRIPRFMVIQAVKPSRSG